MMSDEMNTCQCHTLGYQLDSCSRRSHGHVHPGRIAGLYQHRHSGTNHHTWSIEPSQHRPVPEKTLHTAAVSPLGRPH